MAKSRIQEKVIKRISGIPVVVGQQAQHCAIACGKKHFERKGRANHATTHANVRLPNQRPYCFFAIVHYCLCGGGAQLAWDGDNQMRLFLQPPRMVHRVSSSLLMNGQNGCLYCVLSRRIKVHKRGLYQRAKFIRQIGLEKCLVAQHATDHVRVGRWCFRACEDGKVAQRALSAEAQASRLRCHQSEPILA